jgi:membrane-associated phospholipid phosphatase
MIEQLRSIDTSLFITINQGLSNQLFDAIMPVITSVKYWIPLYVVGILWLLYMRTRNSIKCAIVLLIGILISDPLNSRVIKEIVNRERPCNTMTDVNLRIPKPGGKSFPSSHAVNNAMAAIILIRYFPSLRYYVILLAFIIGFSRVYVGAHYPFDILGGFIIGTILGLVFCSIADFIDSRFFQKYERPIVRN